MSANPNVDIRIMRQYMETETAFGATEVTYADFEAQKNALWPKPKVGQETWQELEAKAKTCQACALGRTRTNVVYGEGNVSADLMFIGEAPGFNEDKDGRPFMGEAGQLLTKIIGAMGLKRQDIYLANCLKCKPSENRSPLPEEVAQCSPILKRQIELIQPKVICALGELAAQTLLQSDQPISQMRGKWHVYKNSKLMPTYHPAYLLSNPVEKKAVWEDMQLIIKELGLVLPNAK